MSRNVFFFMLLSALFHAAVLSSGYIAWPYLSVDAPTEEQVPIPFEFIEITETTNQRAIARREEPEDAPEEEVEPDVPDIEDFMENVDAIPDEDVVETEDIAPEPDAVTIPDEDAEEEDTEVADETKETEDKTEPVEEEPIVRRKTKEQVQQEEFDSLLDFGSQLRDKAREEPRAPVAPIVADRPVLEDRVPAAAKTPVRKIGDGSTNTASLQAAIRRQIGFQWDGVEDQPNPETLLVTLKLELNRDGTIVDINYKAPRSFPIGNRPMQVAMERAMRAAQKAAPYKLPDETYEQWKDIDVTIGPEG